MREALSAFSALVAGLWVCFYVVHMTPPFDQQWWIVPILFTAIFAGGVTGLVTYFSVGFMLERIGV